MHAIWLNIETLVLVFSFIIGAIGFSKYSNPQAKLYVLWLFSALLAEVTLRFFYTSNNGILILVYGFLAPVNLVVFSLILNSRFPMKKPRIIGYILSILLFVIYTLSMVINSWPDAKTFGNIFIVLSIILVFLSLDYFYLLFKEENVRGLAEEPLFFIMTGTLFYHSVNLLVTGLYHRIHAENSEFASSMYILNYLMGTINWALGGYALFLYRRNT